MTTAYYSDFKLTGKIRYRSSFFGKLILQVQYQKKWNSYSYCPHSGVDEESPSHGRVSTCWRDAKITDLTELDKGEALND